MDEREQEKPRYKVVGDLDDLLQKSRHWDRLFPDVVSWREKEEGRIELEAVTEEELLNIRHSVIHSEIEAFPIMWNRIVGDAKDDLVENFISRNRLRYLFLFGVITPDCVVRNKEASVKIWIDWEKAFEVSS